MNKYTQPGRVMLMALIPAALAFGSSLTTWITVQAHTSINNSQVKVTGADAAPAVTSLALVALAATLALRIAGPKVRWLICAMMAVTGVALAWAALAVVTDPAAASMTEVGKATGVVGLGADYHLSAWPWFAAACGVLYLLAALWAVYASRGWAARTKYERHVVADHEDMDEIDTWDSLTAGHDPTR